jgi:hypothetical protein
MWRCDLHHVKSGLHRLSFAILKHKNNMVFTLRAGATMYRIGYPFWKLLARCGVPMALRINVMHDDEAGVFVATSNDLRGLVCEAPTMDELLSEVKGATHELLKLQLHDEAIARPVTDLRICPA